MEPRITMARLPGFMQPFLTWMTGMPLPDEEPLIFWTPNKLIILTLLKISIGIAIGVVGLSKPLWLAIPIILVSWMMVTGGMRMFYVVIEHSCTHNNCGSTPLINRIIGETISILLWTTTYDGFQKGHQVHHNSTRKAEDPDAQFLVTTGFVPDLSAQDFWRLFFAKLVSPLFHFRYLVERMKSNLYSGKVRGLLSLIFTLLLLTFVSMSDIWWEWIILWLVPSTVLFQMSSLVNYISEHRWPESESDYQLTRSQLSYGRFCGERVPSEQPWSFSCLKQWVVWWLRLILVHVPYRTAVLVGDLPQHDLHHRRAGSDWSNAAYVRRDDIHRKSNGEYWEYTNEWGTMADHLSASISQWNPSKNARTADTN